MAFDIEIRIVDEGRPDIRDLVSVVGVFGEGQVLDEARLNVTALRVDHPPVTECYALRFEHGGQKRRVLGRHGATFRRWPISPAAPTSSSMRRCWKTASSGWSPRTGNGARLREHLLASHTLGR